MTILYKANETDFTHFGLGPLNDAVSILVTEERNGIFELEMKYPVSGGRFKDLKNDRIIKADAGHNLKDQRFKIIRITKPLKGIVTVHAEHVSYLSQDLALKPKVTFSGNAQQALSTWKANLIDDNPFIVSSDITTTSGGTWTIDEVENPRRALGGVSGSILDKYGGEYRFDNYQIRLMRQRGVNSAALIAYGRNLTDLTQEEEIANTYTSIYPYAVYRDDDGNEHLLTLPEFYIDSEHVNNFARRKILAVDFSQDEIKTVTALRSAANTYITANSVGVPKVNLKISYVDLAKTLDYKNQAVLEEVNLCDNVPVYFEKFGINTTAKVIKVVWDDIRKHYDSVEIGEARSSLSQAINTTVDGRVSHVEKKVNIIQLQADGMKLIYRQVDRPPNGSHVGDLWYQPNGIYEIMYQWDGSDWKEILNTQDLDAIKREVETALSEAEAAKQAAENAYTNAVAEAERLVVEQTEAFDVKFETETGAIRNEVERGYTDAVTNAQNYIDAETTIIDNKILAVEQEVSDVKGKADQTIADINTAVTNAGFTSLDATISHVKTIGEQANSNAQVAVTSAEQSLQIASELASNAEGMLNNIIDTRGLVNGTYVENKVDDATGELSQKITKIETLVGENIRNLVVRKDEIKNQTLSTTGNHISTLGHSISTKLIPVGEGETLSFQNTEGGWRYVWLNQNKEFISMVIADDNTFTDTAPIRTWFLEVSYTTASSPMITRGSEQKDFVLAPEDNNTDEAFRILQAEYKSDVEGIESTLTEIQRSKVSQTDYDLFYQNEFSRTAQEARDSYTLVQSGVEGRLSTAESTITQQAGLIASKVSQTEFDNVNSRLSAAETTVTQNKNAIDLRATKTEVKDALDNVYTYGRNLISGSKTFLANDGFTVNTHNYTHSVETGLDPYGKNSRLLKIRNTTIGGNYFRITNVIKGKGPFTFSAWMKRPAGNAERVEVGVGTDGVSKNIYVGDTWVRHDITGVAGDNFTTFNFVDITFPVYANVEILIFEPTLVKGEVAQEWTPSFFDTEKLAETTASSLTIESDKINALTTRVSGSETNITNMSQTISGISTTIATLRTDVNGKATITQYNTLKSTVDGTVATVGNHSGRITQVEQNVNGLQTTVASKADQSQITQLSNAITSTVKNAVDTLEANGRNYFHKGLVMTNVFENTNFVKFGDTTPQGFTVTGARSGQGYIRINNVITGNGLWTVTFDLGTPQLVAVGITVDVCDQGARRFITRDDNKQERVSLTVNVTNHSSVYNFVDFGPMDWANFTINNIKIEKGGKSTPYVIAIEDTAPSSQITQLSDQINQRVAKGDVVSQINIEADRTLISSGKILLDGDTYVMGTTFVNDIKAKSLEAVNADVANLRTKILAADVITSTHLKVDNALIDTLTATTAIVDRFYSKAAVINNLTARTLTAITANITSIRSQMLVSDVISSDHIQGGTAMVGKLFSSTASINELTSKTAFINNIKAIDISADKITTGTLDAADVNIINLNASNIMTGTLSSIKITNEFNRGSGVTGTITIDSDINMQASDGSRFLLSEKRISFSDGDYETIVRNDGIDFYRAGVKHMGQRFFTFEDGTSGIRFESRHVGERALSIRGNQLLAHDGVGGREGEHHLYLSPGGTGYVVAGDATGARAVMRARTFELNRGVGLTTYDTGNAAMRLYSEGFIWHWGTSATTSNQMLRMDSDAFRMYKDLDMTGRVVKNTSDRRFKSDIRATAVKGREIIRKLNFVDFFYTKENYPTDLQFGLIGQDSPFIGMQGEDGYWSINTTRQTMLNSLVAQEHDRELTRVSTFVSQHDKEIKLLKNRIRQLEEKMA